MMKAASSALPDLTRRRAGPARRRMGVSRCAGIATLRHSALNHHRRDVAQMPA